METILHQLHWWGSLVPLMVLIALMQQLDQRLFRKFWWCLILIVIIQALVPDKVLGMTELAMGALLGRLYGPIWERE